MKLKALISLFTFLAFAVNPLLGAELEENIDRATAILRYAEENPRRCLPKSVLENAQGLAVVSIMKAGLVVSGRGGKGLIIAKTPQGWSAPSAIGLVGAGLGAQIGAEATDLIIIINTKDAMKSFSEGKALFLSAELSAIAGLHGKTIEKGFIPAEAVRTYCLSKGLFAGISIEGTIILERKEANAQFYGKSVSAEQLLSGAIPPPVRAGNLYKEIHCSTHRSLMYRVVHSYLFYGTIILAGILIWIYFRFLKK